MVEVADLEQATQQRKAEELHLKDLLEVRDQTQFHVGLAEVAWVQSVKACRTQITREETEELDFNTQYQDHQFITLEVEEEE